VFKAKPALLTLIGSVVEAGGASGQASLKNLVPCLVESLSNRDWAVRKSAAETLLVLANVEREFLPEFKSECLKVFENRRFDKVYFNFQPLLLFLVFIYGNLKVD
jgi:hypothetical protein